MGGKALFCIQGKPDTLKCSGKEEITTRKESRLGLPLVIWWMSRSTSVYRVAEMKLWVVWPKAFQQLLVWLSETLQGAGNLCLQAGMCSKKQALEAAQCCSLPLPLDLPPSPCWKGRYAEALQENLSLCVDALTGSQTFHGNAV